VLPFEKESTVAAIRGDIDAEHSSLIRGDRRERARTSSWRWRSPRSSAVSRLQQRSQARRSVRGAVREVDARGQFAGYGNILGATFVADGKEHQAFRWINPETGKAAYYDEEGRSLKRFFLVSPLKFEPRVTSHFSRRRLHPVLNTVRAHTGVDYGAPQAPRCSRWRPERWCRGLGRRGGNQVLIRHDGGLETYYMHLSSFAPAFAPEPASTRGSSSAGWVRRARQPGRTFTFRSARTARSSIPSASAAGSRPPSRSPRHTAPGSSRRATRCFSRSPATLLAESPRQRPDAVTAGQQ
jgi:hypothetical protein